MISINKNLKVYKTLISLLVFCIGSIQAIGQEIPLIKVEQNVMTPFLFEGTSGGTTSMVDLNADGKIDVISNGYEYGSFLGLKIYLQDSLKFEFVNTQSFEKFVSSSIVTGDIDGDNDIDFILAGFRNNDEAVMCYINDGNGFFTENQPNNVFPVLNANLVLQDIDQDSDLDLFVSGENNLIGTTALYLNNGLGVYTAATINSFDCPTYGEIAVIDVENDGDFDFIACGKVNEIENTSLLLNDGLGNFTADTTNNIIDVYARSLVTGDINSDGFTDIMVNGYSGDTIVSFTYLNNSGLFELDSLAFAVGFLSERKLHDLDNDGDLDLVMHSGNIVNTPFFSIALNNGTGSFSYVMDGNNIKEVTHCSMDIADINNDGFGDIMVSGLPNSNSNAITTLYLNNGWGKFKKFTYEMLDGVSKTSMAAGDINGDGFDDLIINGRLENLTFVTRTYINDGLGYFNERPDTLFRKFEAKIELSDFDLDGDLDLLMVGTQGRLYYLNDGVGNFTETLIDSAFFIGIDNLTAGDIDNDGDIDFIEQAYLAYHSAIIFSNDGTGSFFPINIYTIDSLHSSSLHLVNLDSDSLLDLVISGYTFDNIPVTKTYKNLGGFMFEEIVNPEMIGSVNSTICNGDFDNDGDNDLLITGLSNSAYVSRIYQNDGQGHFINTQIPIVEMLLGSAFVTDINNDLKQDFVVFGYQGLKVYLNQGNMNFNVSTTQFLEINGNGSACLIDYDNDGDEDFVLSSDGNPLYQTFLVRNDFNFYSDSLYVLNTFVTPTLPFVCSGILDVTVSGIPIFVASIDQSVATNSFNSSTYFYSLCSGVHDIHVYNSIGDTIVTQFVVPVDSAYVFNNPFSDSIIVDSLGTTLSDCNIDYNNIITAYIDSIWATGNTVNVIWNIVDSNGSNLDTTTYVLNNGNGVYWLQLSVFCPTKALSDYFTMTQTIYFENGMATVGMQENLTIQNITIYPNPTNSYVTIAFDDSEAHLHVTDAQGKRVFTGTVHNGEQLLLEKMDSGVYFFEVITEKGTVVKRVIKN